MSPMIQTIRLVNHNREGPDPNHTDTAPASARASGILACVNGTTSLAYHHHH